MEIKIGTDEYRNDIIVMLTAKTPEPFISTVDKQGSEDEKTLFGLRKA